jgi:RNA recognition motif-containing protein
LPDEAVTQRTYYPSAGSNVQGTIVSRMLYIGNLPIAATEEALGAKFARCGTVVSVKIETHPETGGSKGFGFVEMSNTAEAQTAITRLNMSDYDGRLMSVNRARPASAA